MNNILPFPKIDLRIPPEFIDPANLSRMSEQEQYKLLEEIRTRRMLAVTQYLTLQAERKQVKDADNAKRYDSTIKRIAGHIEKIDASLARVEEYIYKLRGVRLETMEDADEESVGDVTAG
jgi:hypothetical protein